jgi:hypothetical protein
VRELEDVGDRSIDHDAALDLRHLGTSLGMSIPRLGTTDPRFVGREPDPASSSRMIHGSSRRTTRSTHGWSTFKR